MPQATVTQTDPSDPSGAAAPTNQPDLLLTDENWKIFDAFTKLAWDVTNFYARGITFFLAINAVVFGYILKVDVSVVIKNTVSIYGMATTALFLLCSIAFFMYVQGITRTLRTCILSGNPDAIKRYGMAQIARRARFLNAAFAIGSITLIVLMLAAYIVLLVY